MNYIGLAVLAAGAAIGFASDAIAGTLKKDDKSRGMISIVIKMIGFAAAAMGALITMKVI